ncbi:MAG: thiamine diphosphokinase [Microthrixaceae bacterium]
MTTAVVFAAGPLGPESLESLRPRVVGRSVDGRVVDVIIAADGGLDLARRLGVEPDLVIGDMDSVDRDSLDSARRDGVEVREFPEAKDETDYELAIDAAIHAGAERVTVVGSESGRIDHLYATLLTLCSPRFAGLSLDAWLGGNYLKVLNGMGVGDSDPPDGSIPPDSPSTAVVEGRPGAPVSLFAMNGPALGVTTTGLRWGLDSDALEPGSSRGVSNELLGSTASVRVGSGCLAVVVPATPKPSKEVAQ